jgi:hypothetical protein
MIKVRRVPFLVAHFGLLLARGACSMNAALKNTTLYCRITVVESMYENTTGIYSDTQTACIPVIDNIEMGELYDIRLPLDIRTNYTREIQEGRLLLSVNGAQLEQRGENKNVNFNVNPQFTILQHDEELVYHQQKRRRLQQRKAYDDAYGIRSLLIVRISTIDSQPPYTALEMENRIFNEAVSMAKQFEACSFGQLKWTSKGVVDVTVDKPIANFTSGTALREAAEARLVELGVVEYSTEEIADNVMYCLPPTAGGWIASAGTNFWRSQFNDEWCLSLSAMMHELGKSNRILCRSTKLALICAFIITNAM